MEYQEIEALIALKESKNLEFKESTGQLDRSMETLCAFLNGNDWILRFGIMLLHQSLN
jgi:ATP-dependent DNA helicase RecG